MAKKYDLAVKVGTYMKDGVATPRYKNIGVLMTGNDGGEFILLDKTFNPAGVASDRESIMVSLFAPRDNNNQAAHNEAKQDGYAPQPAINDEILF